MSSCFRTLVLIFFRHVLLIIIFLHHMNALVVCNVLLIASIPVYIQKVILIVTFSLLFIVFLIIPTYLVELDMVLSLS